MIYMICYDITDAKRLRKVSNVLINYGIRIQKSFFQCEISKDSVKILTKELLNVIDTAKDRLSIYPLCGFCLRNNVISDGAGEIIKIETFEIL